MQITKTNEKALKLIRCLVHGESGVGKTTSIGTLPESQTLVANAERSVIPLRNKAFPVTQLACWDDVRGLVAAMRSPFKVDDNEIKILVVDSLTAVAELCKKQIIEVDRPALHINRDTKQTKNYDEQMQLEDWGLFGQRMQGLVSALVQLPVHLIVTALSDKIENKRTGDIKSTIAIQGRFAWVAPALFDEVFSMESAVDSEGKPTRVWRTAHNETTVAKDASGSLNELEYPNWTEVFKKILKETTKGSK